MTSTRRSRGAPWLRCALTRVDASIEQQPSTDSRAATIALGQVLHDEEGRYILLGCGGASRYAGATAPARAGGHFIVVDGSRAVPSLSR